MKRVAMLACLVMTATAASAQTPDRTSAWRADIDVVREEFLQADLSYSPAARSAAIERLATLRAHVEQLSDVEISGELARIAALSENAHTRAYLLRNRGWWRRWPVRIWKFSDGWRVVAGRDEGASLVGARSFSIDGRPISEVEAAVRPLFAGNDSWATYMAGYSLTSPDALEASVGAAQGRWIVEDDRGQSSATTLTAMRSPSPEAPRLTPEENWWFLSPKHPALQGWTHVLGQADLPSYLSAPEAGYLVRRCDDALYVQYFRAQDAGSETVSAFGDRVMAEVRSAAPNVAIIVDLRFNTGGDFNKARRFFADLAQSQVGLQPGRLFVVSGIATFSAGTTPVAYLRENSRATIIGDGPGEGLEWWAEGGNVALPHSGITMHFADGAHTYSRAPIADPAHVHLDLNIDSNAPTEPVTLSWARYLSGGDDVLERSVHDPLRCGNPIEPGQL